MILLPVFVAVGMHCWVAADGARECTRIETDPVPTAQECRALRNDAAEMMRLAEMDFKLFACAQVLREHQAERREGR